MLHNFKKGVIMNCSIDHIWLDLKKDVELKGHSLTEVGVPVLSQLFQERVNDWLSKSETQPFKFNPSETWFEIYAETMVKAESREKVGTGMIGWIKQKLQSHL